MILSCDKHTKLEKGVVVSFYCSSKQRSLNTSKVCVRNSILKQRNCNWFYDLQNIINIIANSQYLNINSRMTLASFAKEVNSRLAKCPLVFNGHLANHGLTSSVKEATGKKTHMNVVGNSLQISDIVYRQ